ncbi:GreA/GreB family elongation factor [Lacticaseibacillus hulanensis]|uniref:GreA/GreB family elongation factor n=1 Tax=Lacticaseibacillus hulanensis TaxID=2493111 RepID=UPI000FD98F67|nr:transcription elongation factor GreA [Lacticaseibacillus hulanensis]
MDYFDITPQGMAWLAAEIERCKAKRPALIKRVAAAAALGDRSENAEYTESKRELRGLEGRMRFLDKEMRYGQVVKVADDGVATLGKRVTIRFSDEDGDEDEYNLVGPAEAEITEENLTSVSPLGAAILNHKAGDTCTVHAPAGDYDVVLSAVTLMGDFN